MDPHVAGGAVPVLGIEHVVASGLRDNAGFFAPESARAIVTLQAHRKQHRAHQQTGIHRAVRHVAGFTAFDVHGDMLERERTALIAVTLDANLIIAARRLFHHSRPESGAPCGGEGTVWIVAVRALHESFIHAVFDRHLKLGPNIGVAGVTEIDLLTGQQEFGSGSLVNRMAIRTDHIGLCMGRAPDIGA